MQIIKTVDINKNITNKNYFDECDGSYQQKIEQVANEIIANYKLSPIVLLSGPSGSGKTTTALKLEKYLDDRGYETHTISLDNYFSSLTEKDKADAKQNKFDYESPLRINSKLLASQLQDIIDCKRVVIPKYNFELAKSEIGQTVLKRKENEIIIFEGIHALNSLVIECNFDKAYKLYVSPRTRIADDTGFVLQPKYVRLMRRMVRDSLYRGRTYLQTLKYFERVEMGVEKHVLPYKKFANQQLNSSIDYECSVYKQFLTEEFIKNADNADIKNMLKILSQLESCDDNLIDSKSIIREFIGESHFSY